MRVPTTAGAGVVSTSTQQLALCGYGSVRFARPPSLAEPLARLETLASGIGQSRLGLGASRALFLRFAGRVVPV